MTALLPRRALAAALATFVAAGPAPALADDQPHAGMLRYPDISAKHVVFVYANDLWIVDRDGGQAVPLASPPGAESFAKFSADGKTIAFMGNYDGGRDLYTLPITGGVPSRATHHPSGEVLCDWTPDGKLLFYARGIQGHPRGAQLFTVSPAGGMPEQLPVPYGAAGAISSDGTWLAYTPHTRDGRTWKRYRGGMATDIWLFNLKTNKSRKITDWEGTDSIPMWHGRKLYYVSDAGPAHRLNIWSFDPRSGDRKQVTEFEQHDVKWPSMGPGPRGQGEIVFQNGSSLYALDLNLETSREIEVTVPGARPSLRTKRTDVRNLISAAGISATGKRIAVEARGDVWTLPAENGPPRNLTRTSGTAERMPFWSPDGRWIAYLSDATGEYELYITQSDGKGETKQLTEGSATFYNGGNWSPDSKHILFTDKGARMLLHTVETGETQEIDQDPWGNAGQVSWSHDSRWITYARTFDTHPMSAIYVYDVENDDRHQLTGGMFSDSSPTFDRKGDYIYFASSRNFSPTYSDMDTSFIYDQSQVLIAMPLRADVEMPWGMEVDEESWEDEKDEDEAKEGEEQGEDEGGEEASEADDDEGDDDAKGDDDAAPAHPLHGEWAGTISGLAAVGAPEDSVGFTMVIVAAADGSVSGSMTVMGESNAFDELTFDESTGEFVGKSSQQGVSSEMRGTLSGTKLSGTWEIIGMGVSGAWTAEKTGAAVDEEAADAAKPDKAAERVEIELDGIEDRSFMLPVGNANFGQTAVNDKNQLIYSRRDRGSVAIKLFDLKDDKKAEKTVAAGAMGFDISADGKKLLIVRGQAGTIQGASAGGSGSPVPTTGMIAHIEPRAEWRQIVRDAWRIQRDFFYVDDMHGVDWEAVLEQYESMVADAVTREDVSYIIREMISELNVGHAYYFGGDEEGQPGVGVGLLGADWALEDGAYRIKRIVDGAAWDVDARGPLDLVDVNEGDYVLAVNGIPLDPALDPWSAFVGLAGRPTTLTVSTKPDMDDEAREVVVRPVGGEGNLRFRDWIESRRKYVEEKTDGKVGYIYVQNTGVPGQNDLFRQYFGQMGKAALIIDERWNGGGQIPTRFIELLNRPVTNYWARRDNKDWVWPPDAHHGPKCMLINGLAGSGGDMFPWLFKQAGLGKLIGTRTWGGLVGISGNPALIDGGYTAVPTFGFYEKDGTWGIEGHGVDPDIEVIDDPAKMVDGGDPQLDAAISLMLEEIKKNPHRRPQRPKNPDRSGMGIKERDK